MREIEFRGKSVGRGDWVFGSLIDKQYIVGEMVEFTEEYFYTDFWCRVNPETVGQYTGLKDKHGVKIYEGDILFELDNMVDGFLGVVAWGGGSWVINYPDDSDLFHEVYEYGSVVGNIHDNPELLKMQLLKVRPTPFPTSISGTWRDSND